MKSDIQQIIEQIIRKKAILENYPKPGVMFLSLDALLNDVDSRTELSQAVVGAIRSVPFDAVAGIASRGYLFSGMIANQLGDKAECLVQKVKSKGDPNFVQIDTSTEYSQDALQVLKNTIQKGKKYLLTDDLIATGGSLISAIQLIKACGGEVDTVFAMTELVDFGAREKLKKEGVEIISLLKLSNQDLHKLLLLQKNYDDNQAAPVTYQLSHHTQGAEVLAQSFKNAKLSVALASLSKIKEEAVSRAFHGLFDPLTIEVSSHPASSGVSDQPFGCVETERGAVNRLKSLEEQVPLAVEQVLVSMENGIRYSETAQKYFDFVHVIVKQGGLVFHETKDCCEIPQSLINEIPRDKEGKFTMTWGEFAQKKGWVKTADNPHQAAAFGGVSRSEYLFHALSKALGRLKAHKINEISLQEDKQFDIHRMLEISPRNTSRKLAKKGIFFTNLKASVSTEHAIDLYNQGCAGQSWNIPSEILSRNQFKLFSTGDAFSIISPDVELHGADVIIHVGLEHEYYSPDVLMQEALQLCRCAYEHGARSITMALPEQCHPTLHYSDFNFLMMSLFKASGADRLYFYDKNYQGQLNEGLIKEPMSVKISNVADEEHYQISRDNLSNFLHLKPNEPISLDERVLYANRRRKYAEVWSKLDSAQPNIVVEMTGKKALTGLVIPEIKAQAQVLLCCSANKPLAEKIADNLRMRGEKVKLYHIEGEGAEAKIPKEAEICGALVTMLQSTRPNPEQKTSVDEYNINGVCSYFFETASIARQAKLRGADRINLINPYQFNARSDKAEDNPKGKTGAYVQQNAMLLEAAGVTQVITAECHDTHTLSGSYTSRKMKSSAVQALSVISTKLAQAWLSETNQSMQGQLRLVSPDAGAAKRTKELTQKLQAILGEKLCQTRVLGDKSRDSHQDNSALVNDLNAGDILINPHDKYLITDDETATGSTLCQAIQNMKNNGAQNISVIVVHNNMPLDWMMRQLCLARFLYMGVSDLHFSDTNEMGSLASSFEDFINRAALQSEQSVDEIETQVYHWFKENAGLPSNEEVSQAYNCFKAQFAEFASRIKVHSLADEFANKISTRAYEAKEGLAQKGSLLFFQPQHKKEIEKAESQTNIAQASVC